MQLSAEAVWHANAKDFLNLLDADTLVSKHKVVHFYAPSFIHYKTIYYCPSPLDFPAVSITGAACALDCKHCGGKVLEAMRPASTPEKLLELGAELKQNGALGCLLSGGCRPDGSIPLKQFVPAIEKIKRTLGLTIFVHTGIIDAAMATALKTAGVDASLIDIIGSDETIKKICNLNLTVEDYVRSMKELQKAGLNFVPHVIVGLHEGELKGEFNVLKIISSIKPSALVVIALMPIHNTAMAEVAPPQPADIAKVIATARLMFPKTPLVLGCMRPKGKNRAETDILALKAGADAVAFPSKEAIEYASKHGCELSFSSYCCAQIYADAAYLAK